MCVCVCMCIYVCVCVSPTESERYRALGNKAFVEKNYQRAVEHYTLAIKFNRHNHFLYSNRAAAYTKLHLPHLAATDATTCIELNPSWPKGYSRYGNALQMMNRCVFICLYIIHHTAYIIHHTSYIIWM